MNNDNGTKLITKRAIKEVLKISTKIYYQDKIVDLDDNLQRQIKAQLECLNNRGFRALGLAYKNVGDNQKAFNIEDENELIFYGYASFLDIPKPFSHKMVKILASRRVRVKNFNKR